MSKIETASLPVVRPLIQGQTSLITPLDQIWLATALVLISARLQFTNQVTRAIPDDEIEFLQTRLSPSFNWRVWIARYIGPDLKDLSCKYTSLHIGDLSSNVAGIEHCNTQITTFFVGNFYAHTLYTRDWDLIGRYEGIRQVWPPSQFHIDTRLLPKIGERNATELHEAIARDLSARRA